MDEIDRNVELANGFREVINRCSRENASDTPDYVLAEYLVLSLMAYERAILLRNRHSHPMRGPSLTQRILGAEIRPGHMRRMSELYQIETPEAASMAQRDEPNDRCPSCESEETDYGLCSSVECPDLSRRSTGSNELNKSMMDTFNYLAIMKNGCHIEYASATRISEEWVHLSDAVLHGGSFRPSSSFKFERGADVRIDDISVVVDAPYEG